MRNFIESLVDTCKDCCRKAKAMLDAMNDATTKSARAYATIISNWQDEYA